MNPVLLFDGVCNFCNDSVNFIIRRDHAGKFKFAPLQSDFGLEMRKKYNIADDVDSVVLIEHDQAYMHSTAALRIAKNLGGVYSLAYVFMIVPAFIRDFFYKTFAKNRYRLFGKKDVCMMPTAEIKERFLSEAGSLRNSTTDGYG